MMGSSTAGLFQTDWEKEKRGAVLRPDSRGKGKERNWTERMKERRKEKSEEVVTNQDGTEGQEGPHHSKSFEVGCR
jgi:hypothetical protein